MISAAQCDHKNINLKSIFHNIIDIVATQKS